MRMFILGSYVNAHCMLVERLPLQGESLCAVDLMHEHGGKGLNVAVGLHRLGVQVNTLLAIGRDDAANALMQLLHEENMDTRIVFSVDTHSGFGVGFIAANGDNCLAVYPGANALMDAALVMRAVDYLTMADMVYAQFEIPESPILVAFRHARSLGIRTFLNPSPWRACSQELWALTDVLVVNAAEADCLFAITDNVPLSSTAWAAALPYFAERCHWRGELLVITLAEQGCVALAAGKVIHVPAVAITAVDATGAGDAFNAGLAAALMGKKELVEALTLACACGAWVAARVGVLQALPTHADIFA